MNDFETLRLQVLALPPLERAGLIEDILASFEGVERKSLDEAWAAEARDRLEAYDKGEMEAFTMEEVRKSIGL